MGKNKSTFFSPVRKNIKIPFPSKINSWDFRNSVFIDVVGGIFVEG